MLADLLKDKNLILASGSPRRKKSLEQLNLEFELRLRPIDETFPDDLRASEITDYLSVLKAAPFKDELLPEDILMTSDTIVWLDGKALGKPKDYAEAIQMLKNLSGKAHSVISSICFTTTENQKTVNSTTEVLFKELSDAEINYYVNTYKPLDKAGAYGIQEWIGMIGISKITGSYENVVGLPTHLFYKTLVEIVRA